MDVRHVLFELLIIVSMKGSVTWDVMLYGVLEEHTATVFKVKEMVSKHK
jgi:hypothetical protein